MLEHRFHMLIYWKDKDESRDRMGKFELSTLAIGIGSPQLVSFNLNNLCFIVNMNAM